METVSIGELTIGLARRITNSPTHQFTNSPNSIVLSVQQTGAPRVVITGIGVVSPFGVGRERFWDHISRGCSGTRAITEFDAVGVRLPRRRAGAARDDRRCAADRRRRHLGRAATAPIRSATRGRRSSASSPRARRGSTPGCASASRSAGVIDRQRRRRHRRRRTAVQRLLRRARPQGHAVRDPGVDRRHGVERDFDFAAAARHQPRALVRLHQLDRRDRLRGGADSRRAKPTCAVGRHRRVRHARHDLRLLAHEGRVDGVQRHAGGRVAAVRSRPRRLRARRGRLDGRARARGSRAGARRDDLRVDRRLRIDLRRVPPRADGARRRGDRARDHAGDRAVGTPARKTSATSTITGPRRC